MDLIASRPYQPNPQMCCERCVFGNGEHAPWCDKREPEPPKEK